LFVFTNWQRDKVKILQWEVSGFWVHYKRLERGRFQWSENTHDKTVAIDPRQLRWLLDGLSLSQRQAHKKVSVRAVMSYILYGINSTKPSGEVLLSNPRHPLVEVSVRGLPPDQGIGLFDYLHPGDRAEWLVA